MKEKRGTIRFIIDPVTKHQLASIVVYQFGTMNFKWADPDRPLLANLGEGIKITVTHTSDSMFQCMLETENEVLHDVELNVI